MGKRVRRFFATLGVDWRRVKRSLCGIPAFFRDARNYRRQATDGDLSIRISHLYPIFADRYDSAGVGKGHYFNQDLWAARLIYQRQPGRHVDIGSSVNGFVAHILVFVPRVEVVDIRPLKAKVSNLAFVCDDATTLEKFADNSLDSLSSLHAAEHFGLGRYGDPVSPDAHIRFMKSLQRVLQPGGRLYFSVPIGRERLEFNAHRVLAPETIMSAFDGLKLVSFALVKDDGFMDESATLDDAARQEFGCGLFEFTK
ncbi:DUF268 domain-containing protein [Rhodospirillaceae bacterium SYSU D60014]|uniref:DUF268 domain-containing protein n=1 Tax=Virgifigura deserti TaxID=2268457 RepID=UPI000E65F8BE